MSLSAAASRWLRDDAWQRRVLVLMTAAVAGVYVVGVLSTAGVQRAFVKGDARSYFAFLPSLVLDRDVDLRNQFAVLKPEGDKTFPFGVSPTGRAATPFPVTPALLWLPGYAAGLLFDRVLGTALAEPQPLGYGFGAALGAALWSILLAGLGLEATRTLVGDIAGAGIALPAVALSWVATSALYYTAISPLYSHAPGLFAVSMMLWSAWRAARQPDRPFRWAASGLAAGLVAGVRIQDAALLTVPAALLLAAIALTPSTRQRVGMLAAWTVAAAAGYLPEAWVRFRIDHAIVPLGAAEAMKPFRVEELAGILFSTGYRGWISWTPIVLPGLGGLILLGLRGRDRAARWLAWSGLVGVAVMLALDATHPFGAGAAFGGRRYVSVTPLLAVGLAALLGEVAGRGIRRTARVVLPALAVWNLCVLLSYELLTIRHGIYPSLAQAVRYVLGGGVS